MQALVKNRILLSRFTGKVGRELTKLQRYSRYALFSHTARIIDETFDAALPRTSQPLGSPLPKDEHACSVSLPTWSAVVGYEEGDPSTTQAMKCGYPRFVYHPYVLKVMEYAVETFGNKQGKNEDCIVLPSLQAAARCQLFLQKSLEGKKGTQHALLEGHDAIPNNDQNSRIRVVDLQAADVHAVFFPAETMAGMEAKAYWQHTGEIVSSRRAECCLKELKLQLPKHVTDDGPLVYHSAFDEIDHCPYTALRSRIAGWASVPNQDYISLMPSGMASIYTALRSAQRYHLERYDKSGASIVYGFPYLDTLKMCSRDELCPDGVEFFGGGDSRDLANLEQMLKSGSKKFSVLVTEVPSNPLLQCPDLFRLRELADEYDFMLVVDDTISTFLNVNIIEQGLADAVCSSLTKIVSGRGDCMAGSLVMNPNTSKGRWMQHDIQQRYTPHTGGLFAADALAVLRNSADFPSRNSTINETAESLADWLHTHEDVQRVYYPKFSAPLYAQVQSGGFGGLISILLHSHVCQRTFYDALDVAKGPSLGTNFTLVCPYTLLAHYHELNFAMSYNVSPNLLRIAVGLEPLEALQAKFETAFAQARLHPKIR